MTNFEIVYHPLIIPTVVIPFAALLAGLSALATFVAGFFGLKLKAEGPKKLLELLLKPRILVSAVLLNLVCFGGYRVYKYWSNAPVMLWRIEQKQSELAQPAPKTTAEKQIAFLAQNKNLSGNGKIELLWERQLEAGSFRGLTVSEKGAYLGTDAGIVHQIDLSTGDTIRRFFIGTSVSAAVTVHGNSLFAGEGVHDTHGARVYKFDLLSGQFEGAYASRGHIEGKPVAVSEGDRELVFVPSGDDGLNAVDAKSLKRLWNAKDGHNDSAVRIQNGIVFAGTGLEKENRAGSKGRAFAYELMTGKKLWSRELPASNWMQPITWRDNVCFVFGEVYFQSDLGGVYCFKQADGTPGVSYNNAAPIVAEPILVGDDLVVSDIHGKVCRVSLETGLSKWCQETGAAKVAFGNPVLDRDLGILVYASAGEGVFVFEPDTGAVLAKWKPDGDKKWSKTYAPVAMTGDGWVTVDMKGVMRRMRWAIEIKNAKLSR